jgi:hypothetical protein
MKTTKRLLSAATAAVVLAVRGHVLPAHPVTEANTATGGEFHADGRILVLVLKSGSRDNR